MKGNQHMSSLLQQHLGTNYIPSIEEISQIKGILEVTDKEIREIDIEIDQLRRQLHLLLEKRSRVHDFAEQRRALISPVRRLNRDILQEIFLACLPEDRNPCMSATEAPILLTRICSSWRSIAQSLSRLWSAIHIVLPCFTIGYTPKESVLSFQAEVVMKLAQRQSATMEWLDRSRGCPLSISVYQTSDFGPVYPNDEDLLEEECQLHLSFVINTLLPYSKKWKDIDFCLRPDILNPILKNWLTAQHTPLLRRFHITSQEAHRSLRTLPETFLSWENIVGSRILSSQLTHITILGSLLLKSDLSLIPHSVWTQVTELTLDTSCPPRGNLNAVNGTVSLVDITRTILCHCQSLETLKLNIFTYAEVEHDNPILPPNFGTITLPSLKAFSLEMSSVTSQLIAFANSIQLPSLENFDLQICRGRAPRAIEVLLQNIGQNLQSLGLYGLGWKDDERMNMVKLLQLTPNLKCLRFTSKILHFTHKRWPASPGDGINTSGHCAIKELVNDNLLNSLSPLGKAYSDIICPQLEVFDCDLKLYTGISSSALKEFVAARQNGHLDDRIASPRRVCIKLEELRKPEDPNEKQVSLGKDSTVYFKKDLNNYRRPELSPMSGLVIQKKKPSGMGPKKYDHYEAYTYL